MRVVIAILAVLYVIGIAIVGYGCGWNEGHRVGLFDGKWECSQQQK